MYIHCKIIKLGLVSNLTHKVPELKDYLETDGGERLQRTW